MKIIDNKFKFLNEKVTWLYVWNTQYWTIFQDTLQESKFDKNNSPDSDDNDLLEPLTIFNLWQEGKKL